jgi:guanylate kinase
VSAGAGLLLIISGPSGVGKTTITRHLQKTLGADFSVSVTTRAKTREDVDGRDYWFITHDEFVRRRDAGELLEWAQVYPGMCYGTPRKPVDESLAAGRLMILEIDVQGAIQVKAKRPQAFGVFILPPDEQTLLQRLRGRGREDESIIQKRFAKAQYEIHLAQESGVYDVFLVNDELDEAQREAVRVVRQEWDRRRG